MKLVFSTIFSVLILLAGTKNLFVLADYDINRDYYEKICKNKDKSEMKCHGKCQMAEKTKKGTSELNFERFSFDFYLNPSLLIGKKQSAGFRQSQRKIDSRIFITISAVTVGVPNPPPNSGFN